MFASGPITLNGRFLQQEITGVQRVAREVLHALDEMAYNGEIETPRVLLPARGNIVAPPILKAIHLTRVGLRTGHLWEQLELPCYCGREPLLCLGNTAPLARLFTRGRPTVTMVHDLSYRYFPHAYKWRFRRAYETLMPHVLRRSEAVVTVSQSEVTQMKDHFPFLRGSSRLSFLQNGGIPDRAAKTALRESLSPAEGRPYGIYVGSLTQRKNARGLLQAAVTFLREYREMRFVIIGENASTFDRVALDVPADVANRLEFLGQVNDAEKIYAALRCARFLLFPSFYEASPLPPVEAMTFGCPVIVSKIPSLIERCGTAALYCDPNDQGSIMSAVRAVMDTPGCWHRFSSAARAQAARYSWAGQTRGLLDFCEAVR